MAGSLFLAGGPIGSSEQIASMHVQADHCRPRSQMQRCGSSRSRQKIRPRFSPQSLLTDWGALALDLESHRLHCRQEFRGRAVHECELIVTVRGGSDQIRRVDQYNRAPCAARAIDGGGDELCSCRAGWCTRRVAPATPTRSRPSNQIREGKQCEDVRAGSSSSSRPQGQYRSSCAGARIGTCLVSRNPVREGSVQAGN